MLDDENKNKNQMENKDKHHESDTSTSYNKYLIVFALLLFAGIIIFNAVNSPMISGANIIYVNNPTAVAANGQQGQDLNATGNINNSSSVISNSTVSESSLAQSEEISSQESSINNYNDNQEQNNNQETANNQKTNTTNTTNQNTVSKSNDKNNSVGGKININTADKTRLMDIPGVGEVTAGKIIDYRNTYGSFKSVDELINISGIGDKKLENMRPYVTV